MKLSKELVLQAVTAAFEFNTENNHAAASVSYSLGSLTLGLNCFKKGDWVYYKISTPIHADSDMYADSHEENLVGFLDVLKENTK